MFDKQTGRAFVSNPRNIMSETDFNVVGLKSGFLLDFEARFTYIENIAKPVFDKIVAHRDVSILAPDEIAAVCAFIIVQMLRSKSFRENMLELPREIKRRFPEAKLNDLPDEFEDLEYEKFSALRFATENISELASHLISKRMIIFHKNCEGNIYISDNPLVMHNDQDLGPYGNIGLAVPGIQIFHPLSPDLILGFLCPSLLSEMHQRRDDTFRSANQARLALLRNGAPDLATAMARLNDLLETAKASSERFEMIFDKQYAPISPENLLFFNSLQIQYGYRFIAAKTGDFSFMKKALRERPHWKKGLQFQIN